MQALEEEKQKNAGLKAQANALEQQLLASQKAPLELQAQLSALQSRSLSLPPSIHPSLHVPPHAPVRVVHYIH